MGSQTFLNFPAGHSTLNAAFQRGCLLEVPPQEAAADPLPQGLTLCVQGHLSCAYSQFTRPAVGSFHVSSSFRHTRRKDDHRPGHPHHTDEETEAPSREVARKSPHSAEPGVPLGPLTPDSCPWSFPPLTQADLRPGLFPNAKHPRLAPLKVIPRGVGHIPTLAAPWPSSLGCKVALGRGSWGAGPGKQWVTGDKQ